MPKGEDISGQSSQGNPGIDVSLVTSAQSELLQPTVTTATRRRRRLFSALEETGVPHAYRVNAQVLTREGIDQIKSFLTKDDPQRSEALRFVQTANSEMRGKITRVAVLLDGRGQEWNEEGQLIKTPDGWWGDTIQASSVIRSALANGLEVEVVSTQPDLFYQEPGDNITHTKLPDETFPFQFYPFKNGDHTELVEFLYRNQRGHMAYLAPTNSRLPLFFRLEKHRGSIQFDAPSLAAVNALQLAVEGETTNTFEGITQKLWNNICHHTQAYQVATDILGLSIDLWGEFPRPYINPTPYAEILAQDIVQRLSPTGINALLHIGGATNTPRKREKFYPPEQWMQVLDQIAAKRPDLVGSIIIFKPINQAQAAISERIAEHAAQIFGADRVLATPLQRNWNLSALAALMKALADNGIVVGIDSGPAHLARAQQVPLDEVGNKAFDPEYYGPQGGIIVLPARGNEAKRVLPEDVADAFIALAETPLPN